MYARGVVAIFMHVLHSIQHARKLILFAYNPFFSNVNHIMIQQMPSISKHWFDLAKYVLE